MFFFYSLISLTNSFVLTSQPGRYQTVFSIPHPITSPTLYSLYCHNSLASYLRYVSRNKNSIYNNRLTSSMVLGLFGAIFNLPRGHLSRELLSHSSTRTPYDKKSIIVKPCPAVEESVQLSQAGYKIFQRFYRCSAQSNVRTKSVLHLLEGTFMRHQHRCLSSEVLG